MFRDISDDIMRLEGLITEAVEADKDARKAYLDSANELQTNVGVRIEELQAELGREKAANELRTKELAEALSIADVDTALEIEEAMAASNAKITELEHKISLLGRTMPKGNAKLFFAAMKAYRAKFKRFKQVLTELDKIDAKLKEIARETKENQSVVETTQRRVQRLNRTDFADTELIEMVESFEGPIEVEGHSAITDERAKMRYIRGSLSGIEGTPAGKRLQARMKEDW